MLWQYINSKLGNVGILVDVCCCLEIASLALTSRQKIASNKNKGGKGGGGKLNASCGNPTKAPPKEVQPLSVVEPPREEYSLDVTMQPFE